MLTDLFTGLIRTNLCFYRNSNTESISMFTISNILKGHDQSILQGNEQCRMDTAGVVYPL